MLDIDWASLVTSVKPQRTRTQSALKRFQPGAVLASIGVAQSLCGSELTEQVLEVCRKHQQDEAAEAAQEEGLSTFMLALYHHCFILVILKYCHLWF